MSRLIDGDALYEKACDLEAQALDYTVKISNDKEKRGEWLRWSAILAERTAFKHDVYDAPTIEPEPHWIPCSERLPEGNLYVLVTYKYQYGLMDIGITWYSERENKWCDARPIIAWMPLPAPYKEDTDD